MIWALVEPFIGYIAIAGAAIVAFFVAQAKARREGRKQAEQKLKEKDDAEAADIRKRVAKSRRVRPDDRFRD